MIAHKFISNIAMDNPRSKAAADLIMRSAKFDFGKVPGERIDKNLIRIPMVSDVEREAFYEGLLPLPFPLVFYQFEIDGTPRNLKAVSPRASTTALSRIKGEEG